MTKARFKVVFAGPLVSFQDQGRFGHLRFGVSTSGPMDRFAHRAAHALVGNSNAGSAIEVSLGGLILECVAGEAMLTVAGGGFSVQCGATNTNGWTTQIIRRGEKLTLRAGEWGSWCYIAFAGQLTLDKWLGSTSTHSMSGFGAGKLTAGVEFEVQNSEVFNSRCGDTLCPNAARTTDKVRMIVGPQDQYFNLEAVKYFCSKPFELTDAFDRMGVRLSGPKLLLKDALSIPSEPIVRGSVQISGDGVPTVLLADHQTTGGYPKIATVLSVDVDRLAQMRSGDTFRFIPVSAEDAIAAVRKHYSTCEAILDDLAAPKATLAEKLQSLNLIDGIVSAID
ncbi:MAG TPA: allophanate hydrolase [Rhodobacteraceae bacterium]|nr:biotin-dependent carboxyltransferase family protein [Amylibacter sp.]MDG1237230.1 biotin-dependent carboxyltransferase family protein [Amylibacter sp.]MDG1998955.1 biotin-dependent carboxyltransferase family protein [Amylibacter sp.]HAD29668.1 allophanate hydrolase [Paracoccaceae bacterium]|tara:strand:+ start:2999 stop:4009 length:1011 start_codon:yes stop_codon:yes gene_type:complete